MRIFLFAVVSLLGSIGYSNVRAEERTPQGGEIFHDYCSVCHGDKGNGRSRARGSLIPPPRDFTSPAAASELTRDRMIFSVSYGRPNTAMASWSARLSREQIESVVEYIRLTFMKLEQQPDALEESLVSENLEDAAITDGRFDPQFMREPFPFGLIGVPEWGEIFYNDNCSVCHGRSGDGNGPRAYFILPKPRDYRHPASRHKLNRPRLFEVIAVGSHGAEMPAWDKVLTYQEIAHVSEYIFRAFIQPDEDDRAATAHAE